MPGGAAEPDGAVGLSLLTIGECAALLGVGDEAVRRAVARGELRALRLGDGPKPRIRIESGALAEFLRETSAPTVETRRG